MSLLGWTSFAVAAALAIGWSLYSYRRHELAGRGRRTLALLRGLALILLLLLVFDPELPARPGADPLGGPVVLLDRSLSMSLPDMATGRSRWDVARAEAIRLAGARPILVFGTEVRAVAVADLDTIVPDATASRLSPALRAAAELGARRTTVLTDGVVSDAPEAMRWLPGLGMEVEFRVIEAAGPANRALAEIAVPAWAAAGRPMAVGFGVGARGAAGDSVLVIVRQGTAELGRARVAAPADGRIATGAIEVLPRPPVGGGQVRLDVVLEPGDAVPDDDRRSAYVFVTDQPPGVVLVSFAPDWEPRFLQPVLAQALGLPVHGFLRVDGDTPYRAIGLGLDAGATATDEEVRRAAARADLLVFHGIDESAPGWARELAGRHARVLALAGRFGQDIGMPISVGPGVPAEWYPAPDLPPSPLAPLLAGAQLEDAPPLVTLRTTVAPPGSWVPLNLTRGVRGTPAPAAIAGQSDGRRWAVALGEGYWRWSFRGEASRRFYARFWGALAGWVARGDATADGVAIAPTRHSIERGEMIGWRAPGVTLDSVGVRLTAADGASVLDTTIVATAVDSVAHAAPAPGHYAYEADGFADGMRIASGSGEITVESYSPEFLRPRAELAAEPGAARPVGARSARPGRPLHAMPFPYILVALLVAAELILRRRWGLR